MEDEMVNIGIILPRSLVDRIDEQAGRERRSRSNWIRTSLEDLLNLRVPQEVPGGQEKAN